MSPGAWLHPCAVHHALKQSGLRLYTIFDGRIFTPLGQSTHLKHLFFQSSCHSAFSAFHQQALSGDVIASRCD